jgi:hypothetical protein
MSKKLPVFFTFLAFLLLTITTNAQTNYYVSASGGDNLNDGLSPATAKSTIAAAISAATSGDIINLGAGTYVQTTTLQVNKSLTIQPEGSIGSVTIQTSGGAYLFLVTAPQVSIRNLVITKTDDSPNHNLIGVQANHFELAGCRISGQYAMTGGNVSRALEVSGGLTGLNIHDNTIFNLRQPGYINNNVTGNITNNHVYGTRGWVVMSDCAVNFSGNSWGEGITANYYDIAILNATVNKYADIVTVSAANNNAAIENQHSSYGSPVLSVVFVNAAYGGTTKNGSFRDPYNTITQAISRVVAGGKIMVAPGTYTGNHVINKQGISLLSTGGASVTHINSSVIGQHTIALNSGINNVTIGASGKGFTITGFDSNGSIETAAIYLLGSHTNIRIEGNEIVANGEHGIASNFNTAIDNIIINENIFSGKTFTGTEPGGCGSGTQFTASNNVPRQLVVLGGSNTVTNSKNVTFTNNKVIGITGGYNSASGCYQGNTQITIDVIGATISGNIFDGITSTGSSLRTRGNATSIYCNTFYNRNLGERATHIFFFDADPLVNAYPNSIHGVLESNAFPGGATGFIAGNIPGNAGTYFIYRDTVQATAVNTALGSSLPMANGFAGLSVFVDPLFDYSVMNDANACGATVNLEMPEAYNVCGNTGTITKDFPGNFFPIGTTKVTWTVTDKYGNTDTVSQSVTVIDNQLPSIEVTSNVTRCFAGSGSYQVPQISVSDNCGIQSVSYAVSGATSRTGTGMDASGIFNVGTSTVTYTVTDVNGNLKTGSLEVVITAAPVIGYTVSSPDAFCNQLVVTANTMPGADYVWKQGTTVVSTQQALTLGLTHADGVYVLTTTTANGCSSAPSLFTYNKQSVAGNYTILVYDDVKLGVGNKVASGSVGVMNIFGQAIFEQNSSLTGAGAFVKAPKIYRNGTGISLPSVINGIASVVLPVMKYNTASTRNLRNYTVNKNTTTTITGNYADLTIREGANVVLTGDNFKKIEIGAGARVLFNAPMVNIAELVVLAGTNSLNTTVRFASDAEVRISNKVQILSNSRINPDQRKVTFYMGDGNKDDERFGVSGNNIQFTGNVYLPKGLMKLSQEGKGNSNASAVFMTGFFITEDLESSIPNVTWNSYTCGNGPAVVSNAWTSSQFITDDDKTTAEDFTVQVIGNPSTSYFILKLQSRSSLPVQIRVMDAVGRMVETKANNNANSTVQMGHDFKPGVYYAELQQGSSRKVVQLMKVR